MIFFTRKLYEGVQPGSGWERQAEREWEKRRKIYSKYLTVISPMLPPSVRKLCHSGLHDATVVTVHRQKSSLSLVMDTRQALTSFRPHRVRLTFINVKARIRTRGLVARWWLYEEVHLSSRARFALHVFFDKTEIEIEADDLRISKLTDGRV